MKTLLKIVLAILLLQVSTRVQSQGKLNYNSEKEPDELIPTPFSKKFQWGLSLPIYFTTFSGTNLPAEYFAKPSLGFALQAEYFPVKNFGIGIGAGFQQRGAGVINPDKVKTLGDPDSTYIERVRFNNIEFPISLTLRSNDLVKGLRLRGSLSIVPVLNFESNSIVHSVMDGNHLVKDVSNNYQKSDLLFQFSFGPDIHTGYGVLCVHLVYFQGTKNIYQNIPSSGYNQGYGIRLTWLF
jgi:hypothetical protein